MTTIRKHRNVRSLRKEGGAVVELSVITTLRLLLVYVTMHVDRSATGLHGDVAAAISSALAIE